MRSAIFALAIVSIVPIAASCAAEGQPIPSEPVQDAPQTVPEAAAPEPPAKKCATSCAQDSDCQSTCPTPTTGTACCDVASGMCFSHNQSTCPKPNETTQPPAY